ncbi:cellular myosin heavy chain [Clonorchis sinensis]|uniref:Cellular myosin heavy chain n=1 Tax=Clonorchis sinensis TaxID=79923 RepID=G7YGW4_CLOSI|nr:cellular myosin heavy chain [Clonorchis sinensis]
MTEVAQKSAAQKSPTPLWPWQLNAECPAAIVRERSLEQYEELIDKQRSRIKQLTQQMECLEKESTRLHGSLVSTQKELEESRTEVDRKASLLSTLIKESTNKDNILRQLDTILARFTAKWQKQEQKRATELASAKLAEQEARDQLEHLKREYEQDKHTWNNKLQSLESDLASTPAGGHAKSEVLEGDFSIRSMEEKINELESQLSERESQLDELRKQLTEEKQQCIILKTDYDEAKSKLEQKLNKARELMKRASRMHREEKQRLQDEIQKNAEAHAQEIQKVNRKACEDYQKQLSDALSEQEKRHQLELTELREAFQKTLDDASDRYRAELEQLRLNTQTQIAQCLMEAEDRLHTERCRLEATEKQAERWRIAAREAEAARSDLAIRINELLQARCTETMEMLCSTTDDPVVTNDRGLMSHVSVTKTSLGPGDRTQMSTESPPKKSPNSICNECPNHISALQLDMQELTGSEKRGTSAHQSAGPCTPECVSADSANVTLGQHNEAESYIQLTEVCSLIDNDENTVVLLQANGEMNGDRVKLQKVWTIA